MKRNPKLMTLHPELVDRTYTMNEETEYLTTSGSDLEEGMVVLVAQGVCRFNTLDMPTDSGFVSGALTSNRWCTVENLEVVNGRVAFTGVYKDGSTSKRVYPSAIAWLVKRNPEAWRASPTPDAPKPEMTREQKREKVLELVMIVTGARSFSHVDRSDDLEQMTADEIMAVFD